MIFKRLPSFNRDYDKLKTEQQKLVKDSFKSVASALTGNVELYNKYKIKKMKRGEYYEGHLQINLVFTLFFEYDEEQKICWFSRIGSHEIYDNP